MREIRIPLVVSLALTQTDVHWVEAQLLLQRTELFQDVLEVVVAAIETQALEGARCPGCGGRLVRNGRVPLVLQTLLGPLEYRRQRLRCRACGEDVYPLDAALGLIEGSGSTLGVRERALWAATEVSYAKAAGFLEKFAGLEVSHGSEEGGRGCRGRGRPGRAHDRRREAAGSGARSGSGTWRRPPR